MSMSMPLIEWEEAPPFSSTMDSQETHNFENSPPKITFHLRGFILASKYGEFYSILLIFPTFIDQTNMKRSIFWAQNMSIEHDQHLLVHKVLCSNFVLTIISIVVFIKVWVYFFYIKILIFWSTDKGIDRIRTHVLQLQSRWKVWDSNYKNEWFGYSMMQQFERFETPATILSIFKETFITSEIDENYHLKYHFEQ